LDGFEVHEQVVARLRGDEAVAFLIVEPLNNTGLTVGHFSVSLDNLITVRKNPARD
jgi:hypothetical protein